MTGVSEPYRPSRTDLQAARDAQLPDVLAPRLDVLFCGINPSLWSAATGHHFARPGNRFWPALHLSGFTPRQLAPAEQHLLPEHRLGLTNLVDRATARAAELDDGELRAGAELLREKVRARTVRWLAVVGVTAYRTAFGHHTATIGEQPDTREDTGIWVLPNPSGLNAHYPLDALAAEFACLRRRSAKPRG